jgi:hypothetical protein
VQLGDIHIGGYMSMSDAASRTCRFAADLAVVTGDF